MPVASCSHLSSIFDPAVLDVIINESIQALTPIADKFDSFACRGLSGYLVTPILARHFKKTMIVVRKDRKDEESRHSYNDVEGFYCLNQRYLIVDDGISSGTTVRTIVSKIHCCKTFEDAKPIGIFLWGFGFGGITELKINEYVTLPIWYRAGKT